jgi:hypothetical protein
MRTSKENPGFALCVNNAECEDLELRKVYQVVSDKEAEQDGYLRVIDDSGEDYLYPQTFFVAVSIPQNAQELIKAIA